MDETHKVFFGNLHVVYTGCCSVIVRTYAGERAREREKGLEEDT